MKELEFYTLNVFSEEGIRGGNQLAVILADNITAEEMQAITKQFNYSECTFVNNITEQGADVKIFLPSGEISFAGHPTIGTAYVLEYLWRQQHTPRKQLTLNLQKGPIQVTVQSVGSEIGIITMNQFIPEILGEQKDLEYIAEILGISSVDIIPKKIRLISPSKLPFMFIPVKSVETLQNISPDHYRMQREFQKLKGEPFVFTTYEEKEVQYVHARFFAPNSGIVEDPATGSAQASLAMYMQLTSMLKSDRFITKQGIEMGRPSVLYNYAKFSQNRLVQATTGGKCVLISHGALYL